MLPTLSHFWRRNCYQSFVLWFVCLQFRAFLRNKWGSCHHFHFWIWKLCQSFVLYLYFFVYLLVYLGTTGICSCLIFLLFRETTVEWTEDEQVFQGFKAYVPGQSNHELESKFMLKFCSNFVPVLSTLFRFCSPFPYEIPTLLIWGLHITFSRRKHINSGWIRLYQSMGLGATSKFLGSWYHRKSGHPLSIHLRASDREGDLVNNLSSKE